MNKISRTFILGYKKKVLYLDQKSKQIQVYYEFFSI